MCGRGMLVAVGIALALASATPASAQNLSNPPPPPGANDGCKPWQDPTPVVLVHGTFANRYINFIRIAPDLESHGYCTWALNYGDCNAFGSCGRGPIQDSAAELRRFINTKVLPHSRSGKVSIVGHSQGGLMPRYYIKFLLNDRSLVKDMVSLSASNHGTDHPLAPYSVDCTACRQQHPYRGAFTEKVNGGDETPGPIAYTQIQTRFDDVVFPYYSSYLADDPDNDYHGPRTRRLNGPMTTNYCLQDRYPADVSDHHTIAGDPNALAVIRAALQRPGPAAPPPEADTVCATLAGDSGGDESSRSSEDGTSDSGGQASVAGNTSGGGVIKPRGGVDAGFGGTSRNEGRTGALLVAGSMAVLLGLVIAGCALARSGRVPKR